MVEEDYLIIYPGGVVLRESVHCSGVYWPPNHPGGGALIKRKNKRFGSEPMTKQ